MISNTIRSSAKNWIISSATLAVISAAVLLPILVVVWGSFENDAWRRLFFEAENTKEALGYSFILALRAPFAALLGFVIAWFLVRWPLPGRKTLEFSFWIAFMMPLLPLTLGWALLLDEYDGLINQLLMRLPFVDGPVFNINSISGIIWVHMTASSVPVMVILLAPAIRQMDKSQEEAARMSGAKPAQILNHVTIPLLFTAIATGTMLGFIRGLEAFEVEQLLGPPVGIYVYTTRVFDLVNWEPPRFADAMALSTLVLVFLVGLAAVHRRLVSKRSHATLLGRGISTGELAVGRWRYAISIVLFLIVGVTVILPSIFLVLGSFMSLFGFFAIEDPYTLNHWRTVFADRGFTPALKNSLIISLGAGFLGTLVCALLAYIIMRTRLYGRMGLDFLVWLPWCIPGILLGVGLLSLVLSTPQLSAFYGSLGLLIFAIVVSQLPLGVNMMKSSIGQVGRELEEAASISGASRTRVFLEIVLPLVRPMIVSVFVLIIIAGLRDISTLALLAQPSTSPLSILLFEYATSGAKEAASVIGLVISVIIVMIAVIARKAGLTVERASPS